MRGRMRLRSVLACALLPVVLCVSLWLVLPLGSQATTPQGRAASIQQKIKTTRGKIGRRKGTERVLSSDIARYTTKIRRLEGSIATLQTREQRIQADLDAHRAAAGARAADPGRPRPPPPRARHDADEAA